MLTRLLSVVAVTCLTVNLASAQIVRFDTTVGTFDMVLNPTFNENLQPHVNNLLAYVNSGRYNRTVINRAAEDFVLQLGGFQAPFLSVPENFDAFPSVPAFDPVIVDANGDGQVDFDTTGLTNTRGTVTLALSNNPNTGTSSFFVNLGDNAFLDAQGFVPFAEISNMATINLIMGLPQVSIPGGGLASQDIPTIDETRLIIIEQVFVVAPPAPLALPDAEDLMDLGGAHDPPPQQMESSVGVPEPSGLVLSLFAAMLAGGIRRRGPLAC